MWENRNLDKDFSMPNIFEEAGRSKPKPKPTQVKEKVPFGHSKKKEELDQLIDNPASIKLKDVDDIVGRLHEMHDDIEKKLDLIYQKTGLTPKYIKDYLANPNNFNTTEWERVQKERQALLGSLMGAIKIDETPEEKADNAQKESDKSNKERRGKMIGTRKNWIPMR
jgi:hypothetical protein